MSDCPWCSDVEAPPNSCPLHYGQPRRSAVMRNYDNPEREQQERALRERALQARISRLEVQLKLAKRQGYGEGLRDGIISILFFLVVVAIIYMQFRVGA